MIPTVEVKIHVQQNKNKISNKIMHSAVVINNFVHLESIVYNLIMIYCCHLDRV